MRRRMPTHRAAGAAGAAVPALAVLPALAALAARAAPAVLALVALVTVAGCAAGSDTTAPRTGSSSPTPSGPTASTTTADTAQNVVEITVSVQNGQVVPKPRRVQVPLGSEIRLQVTSDVDDEVHVHGFDVEEPVEAGRTATITLQADEAGLYEVETHESGLQLLQLEIR